MDPSVRDARIEGLALLGAPRVKAMLRFFLSVIAALSCWIASVAASGVVVSGNSFVVTTDGGLVFTETSSRVNLESTSPDVTSMKFNGIKTQSNNGMRSQISSGIGASCSWVQGDNENNNIIITCTTSTLTQYYVARQNDPAIHMSNHSLAPQPSPLWASFASNVAAWMIIPGTGYESSSGGPFMRDINNQNNGDQELYFYMNSSHTQTEAFRQGFHGPYALWFTTGATPAIFDTTFWATLPNISAFVAQTARGRVIGKASNFRATFSTLISIGWTNSAAEYWVSPFMKPGTYIMTLYEVELAVGSTAVTVSAGGTTTANIASSLKVICPSTPIWTIGNYDGTPRGFLNADAATSFPMAIFQAIGPVTIRTILTSSQIGTRILAITTTLAFAGGCPVVSVGSFIPLSPNDPDSRGVTRRTWRGEREFQYLLTRRQNILYTYAIPAGAIVVGTNTITISVASGSSGATFLSPNIIFDALWFFWAMLNTN
ncbi:polysaccharide lyase family 4 protein [Mycena olivaceomarginata]|nr:polysaccharide lyase family 4 protein [Mycena olivaceomarginata]